MEQRPFPTQAYLSGVAKKLDPVLLKLADERVGKGPPRLVEAIRYALTGSGKRIRPALVLASCAAYKGDYPGSELALKFAASVEAIHAYSLVHDDLPALDNDDLRRGRPTVHKAYDEATAILVGDALQTIAFRSLLAETDPRAKELTQTLADAAYLMVEGQARDLAGQSAKLSEEEVNEMMVTKTGALIAVSVGGGAVCAGAPLAPALAVGRDMGLAFQIVDDLLDLTAETADLGKRAGKDASLGKSTLHALVGTYEARNRAEDLVEKAIAGLSTQGPEADPLRALARYLVTRKR